MRSTKHYIYWIILSLLPNISWAQPVDTITTKWDSTTLAICTVVLDSLKFDAYNLKKDAEFDSFFDTLTVEERRNIYSGIMRLFEHPDTSAEWQKKWEFYEGIRQLFMSRFWRDQAEWNRQYYAQRFDTIILVLWHEGKQMDLNNNFGVYFITQKGKKSKCIQAQTVGNSFIVPNLGTDTSGIIMFEYRHQYYTVHDGRDFVSKGRTCYQNLYNIKSAERLKMIFDTEPYNRYGVAKVYGRKGKFFGEFFEDEYDSSHSSDLNFIQERYKNITGFFSVHGCRWNITGALIPIYSVDDFFSRNKKVMNKAKRGKPFFDMLPVF